MRNQEFYLMGNLLITESCLFSWLYSRLFVSGQRRSAPWSWRQMNEFLSITQEGK